METRNAFGALEEASSPSTGLDKERKEADAGSLPQGRVFVLGHSQAKPLDSLFCARDRKRRTRMCLPGAGKYVQHVLG